MTALDRVLAEQRECVAYINGDREGHPLGTEDVEGARRGLADWVVEEVLLLIEERDG